MLKQFPWALYGLCGNQTHACHSLTIHFWDRQKLNSHCGQEKTPVVTYLKVNAFMVFYVGDMTNLKDPSLLVLKRTRHKIKIK